MIEWLSDNYGVNINAILLSYIKTKSSDELLAKTSIISEETEQERRKKQKKFEIEMSDEPGAYDVPRLKQLLLDCLASDKVTNKRMREIFLPSLLKKQLVTREQLRKEFVDFDPDYDESKVGYYLTVMSSKLGLKKNDFLRQVITYDYPRHKWEKDNFSIRDQYRDLIKKVLEEIKKK